MDDVQERIGSFFDGIGIDAVTVGSSGEDGGLEVVLTWESAKEFAKRVEGLDWSRREEWEDALTKRVVRLFYDGETDCFPVVVVDGKDLSPHGAFGYLVRRVQKLDRSRRGE